MIHEYDALYTSLHLPLGRDLIARAKRLRAVATPSTGLDHLDLAALESRGIALVSLKHERAFLDGITATAEQA